MGALTRQPGVLTVNPGTGRGYSVLEVIAAFGRARAAARCLTRVVARRPGDIAQCYADPALAHSLLGWVAERGPTRCATIRGAGGVGGGERRRRIEFRAGPPGISVAAGDLTA